MSDPSAFSGTVPQTFRFQYCHVVTFALKHGTDSNIREKIERRQTFKRKVRDAAGPDSLVVDPAFPFCDVDKAHTLPIPG